MSTLEQMEEQDGSRIGGVERQEIVDIVRKEDDTPVETIDIGGLDVNMNVEGQPENFYCQTLQREEGAIGSSAGGSVQPPLQCLSRPGPFWA